MPERLKVLGGSYLLKSYKQVRFCHLLRGKAQAPGAHLGFGRWVPSNAWRHHCCHGVCIHLVHSCIAAQPVESLQQQLQCAVIGCWQLGYDQVCQSWLLTTMLNELGKQPVTEWLDYLEMT